MTIRAPPRERERIGRRAIRALADSGLTTATRPTASSPTPSERRSLRTRIPAPRYRHAAPSAPWPWMEFGSYRDAPVGTENVADFPDYPEWNGYPQSLFGNWKATQVARSRMLTNLPAEGKCAVYKVDVRRDGTFKDFDPDPISVEKNYDEFWDKLSHERTEDVRVRALFIHNLTLPVLKMLGTNYNIEPFFFSSSTNWIPSRYQEDITETGDHITVTLPFLRAVIDPSVKLTPEQLSRVPLDESLMPKTRVVKKKKGQQEPEKETYDIDTLAPLTLRSTGRILLQDLLALHMVRTTDSCTVVSYHPNKGGRTSARHLQDVFQRAGSSVYWNKIFERSNDPTFCFLAMMWYAAYAWDEALEVLYAHITWLETEVITTNDFNLTRELHAINAHLLHYSSLLADFRKSIEFIEHTPHPGLVNDRERAGLLPGSTKTLMQRECSNLMMEIERLEALRETQNKRLKNVMDLAFATVNIEDSKRMRRLTEATVRDSAAMKQISYLTMIFLPASFVAGIFGMNVKEINQGSLESLAHYATAAVIMTLITVWVVVALQRYSPFHETENERFLRRIAWPGFFMYRHMRRTWDTRMEKQQQRRDSKKHDPEGKQFDDEDEETLDEYGNDDVWNDHVHDEKRD